MEIQLTKDKTAIIDDEDFDLVNKYKWHCFERKYKLKSWFYAACQLNNKTILMHRLILPVPKGMCIDHKDGNGLNNCKNNIRICSHKDNLKNQHLSVNNTSGYKGVQKRKIPYNKDRPWFVVVIHNGKQFSGGIYETAKQAAMAYDIKALELHGEFAATNKNLGLL